MGMDVVGLAGGYFRASVWSWRPIHALCDEAIKRYELPFDTKGWQFNDGNGLKDPEQCIALAGALDNLLDEIDGEIVKAPSQKLQGAEEKLVAIFGGDFKDAYRTNKEHVRKFCTFLRSCGGFRIH